MTYVSNQTGSNVVSELLHADDGAVARRGRGAEQAVFGVGRAVQGAQVVRVRRQRVNRAEQALLEEKLSEVLGAAGGVAGAVGDVGLDRDVDVGRPRDVVSREQGQELGHALGISHLDTTQEGLVVGGAIGALGPAVQKFSRVRIDSGVARVSSGGVARPDGECGVRQRLTSLDVDDADVEVEVHTGLSSAQFADVVALDLAVNRIRAPNGLRSQNAGVVLDGGVLELIPLAAGGPGAPSCAGSGERGCSHGGPGWRMHIDRLSDRPRQLRASRSLE